MKSIIVDKIKNEFGLRNIGGKKIELYRFYTLCGFYKQLKAGEDIK